MILLAAFTGVQAFLVGTLTAFYNIEAVAIAFAVTSAVVVAITIFAINTKIDVTRWGTMLLVALVAFIVLLIIGMFWTNKILYLVISGIACLLFSAYLVSGSLCATFMQAVHAGTQRMPMQCMTRLRREPASAQQSNMACLVAGVLCV
jgi:FtsH-binding integral membrane protein